MKQTNDYNAIREHAANLPHSPELDPRMNLPEHATKAAEATHIYHYDDDDTPASRDHDRDEAWRNRFEHYY